MHDVGVEQAGDVVFGVTEFSQDGDGVLTGEGRVVKAGKRVIFAEAEIKDGDGKLIARASGTEIPAEA